LQHEVVRDEDKEQEDDDDEQDGEVDDDEQEGEVEEPWSDVKAGVNFNVCERRLERALVAATLGAAAMMVSSTLLIKK